MRPFLDKPLEGFSVRVAVLTVGLLAVMGLVTGCSSQCESICSEANTCTVAERPTDVDCPHSSRGNATCGGGSIGLSHECTNFSNR
jgi:hypothetical protein